MIDLHCHILPGIDDAAANLGVSLGMAEASAADGVSVVVCTPHIFGLYHNAGPQIASAVQHLQDALGQEGIPLRLVAGADVHMVAGGTLRRPVSVSKKPSTWCSHDLWG